MSNYHSNEDRKTSYIETYWKARNKDKEEQHVLSPAEHSLGESSSTILLTKNASTFSVCEGKDVLEDMTKARGIHG